MKFILITFLALIGIAASDEVYPRTIRTNPTTGQGCLIITEQSPTKRSVLTCALEQLPPGRHCKFVPGDQRANYPHCCPRVRCPPPPIPALPTLPPRDCGGNPPAGSSISSARSHGPFC